MQRLVVRRRRRGCAACSRTRTSRGRAAPARSRPAASHPAAHLVVRIDVAPVARHRVDAPPSRRRAAPRARTATSPRRCAGTSPPRPSIRGVSRNGSARGTAGLATDTSAASTTNIRAIASSRDDAARAPPTTGVRAAASPACAGRRSEARRARHAARGSPTARSRSGCDCARTVVGDVRERATPGRRRGQAHSRPSGSAAENLRRRPRRASSVATARPDPRPGSSVRALAIDVGQRRLTTLVSRRASRSRRWTSRRASTRTHQEADAAVGVVEDQARAAASRGPRRPAVSTPVSVSKNGS